jgi:predicted ribonuclease YlaK
MGPPRRLGYQGAPGAQRGPAARQRGHVRRRVNGRGFSRRAGHLRKANPDEEFLERVALFERAVGHSAVIVTGDLGMRLRADARGHRYAEMPAKYAKDALRRKEVGESDPPA